ncbi:PREDICTED: serine/threonine-protein kinase pakD-like [Dufourea novaeangliae]|uniref:serine/threonine-protein kinase pakD-like n=1 Tax=Dufourea novaeangliae TaxID=178035 RepID=UPI000767BE10|nr:PREDICTED: serine/threonine-protein kinase pakD-like [Dufourea novaeangliae]
MLKKNRKRKLEEEEQQMVDWEQENIFPNKIRNEMESMWEIPHIFHFLHLSKEALNIPHLSMYEMERMLLIPRASKQLANIMTSLLSSPVTKAKLRKIPPMPYEFWTNVLAYKVKTWFKVYEGKRRDVVKVLETIGVEPEFWNVFPDAPLLNGKDFEELSFRQKVWLLKTVCDTVMHTRKTVQEEVAKQPMADQFETVLGTDRYGARYIYFPQFLKTDLRVYRHCLDNKILSTAEPVKPQVKPDQVSKATKQNNLMRKKAKQKRRKSRWSNGLPPKSKKKVNKCDEKDANNCKCASDSATGSLINEDTNLSSTSTCSNNNNSSSNNNNINLDTLNAKRSRSLSKCSDMSMESDKSHCKSIKSSGYDTNCSAGTVSDARSPQKMFKGFSSGSEDKCNIEIISTILSDLKSKPVEQEADNVDESLSSQSKLEMNSTRQYVDTHEQCIDGGEAVDNSSNVSKTDDEKLNEIISAECLKNSDKIPSKFQITIISKSDDEKLNETKTNQIVTERSNSSVAVKKNGKEMIKKNGQFVDEQKLNNLDNESKKMTLPERISKSIDDNKAESDEDKDISLSELRSRLQKEAMDDSFSIDEESEIGYNLRNVKNATTDLWKQEVENFNEMLSELSVSNFQLVANSVSSFRDFITTFSEKSRGSSADAEGNDKAVPPCEVKLIKKMTELLSSLENMGSVLHDSMKKARGKLHKEWTNFKEGSVEDQDSSGEGVGSNWWVLGSQGCPLPTPGDATLQTLPQPTLSPTDAKNSSAKQENCEDEHIKSTEPSKSDQQESKESESKSTDAQKRESERDEDNSQESTAAGEEKESSTDEEQQSRRVLRARGVSSYTEQFYSDDEIEEKELEEWTDVEAVYAAPSTQASTSTPDFTPKAQQFDDRNSEEDSDKDWILPSSRKRKNKRPSANRRLKSFQHKLQSIKVNELQEAAESIVATSSSAKNDQNKPKIKEVVSIPKKPNKPEASQANNTIENSEAVVENNLTQTVPSAEPVCKLENIESVHSELDIKDEGPIYDYTPNHPDNSCTTNLNPNYVMVKTEPSSMNYYVMQPNVVASNMQPGPIVSSIISPMQQGYYMQSSQNYIIQNPQPGFIPAQPFQPQGPQMVAPQQFLSQPAYVPYTMPAAQPQRGYPTTDPRVTNQGVTQNLSNITSSNSSTFNRPPQPRFAPPRQMFPHPNGAVIRSSSMPIRGNSPRIGSPRGKSIQQQRGTPVRVKKLRKPNTPAENTGQKTTSLIVLSDSDDEIEMIITEKTGPEAETARTKAQPRRNSIPNRQNPTVTSSTTVPPTKGVIPPQIMERMNQGGISITPVKSVQPVQNSNTQLVVVVNETGSHYALALPNGSKLILTPEQVAQIRASNGGKLIL